VEPCKPIQRRQRLGDDGGAGEDLTALGCFVGKPHRVKKYVKNIDKD